MRIGLDVDRKIRSSLDAAVSPACWLVHAGKHCWVMIGVGEGSVSV